MFALSVSFTTNRTNNLTIITECRRHTSFTYPVSSIRKSFPCQLICNINICKNMIINNLRTFKITLNIIYTQSMFNPKWRTWNLIHDITKLAFWNLYMIFINRIIKIIYVKNMLSTIVIR